MLARMTTALILVSAVIGTAYAGPIVLENTIPSGSLFTQPPVLTGAAPLFGEGGVVVADAFTAPVSAALSQISVVVDYEFFLPVGVTGTSPLLLTLLNDDGDSPGTPIESWIVPLPSVGHEPDDRYREFHHQRAAAGGGPVLGFGA